MEISHRTNELGTENAFVVLAEVNKMLREGKDIISFCIGQPDFDTPQNIKDAAIKAINDGKTGYTDSAGAYDVRKTVADYVNKSRGLNADPDDVVIANGAKPFIAFAIQCTTDYGKGHEVIYPNPGYPIYESQARVNGTIPVPLPLVEKKGFNLEVEELKKRITPNTKLLILNTPQNPTGGVLDEDVLKEVAELAKKHDFWIFSDEIYSKIIYGEKFTSIASLPGMYERTIIMDGVSKAYAMTGWRMGFMANPVLAKSISKWVTNTESCPNHIAQYAMKEAFEGPQEESLKMVEIFRKRKDLIVKLLNKIEGVSCINPKGAFYVFPNVTKACKKLGFEKAEEMRKYLLEHGAAVLADTHFGKKNPEETQQYIRLSYATSAENIIEGCKRIKEAIETG